MRSPLRSLNTIFGRLALLSIALLVLVQVTSLVVVDRDRGVIQAIHVSLLVRYVFEPENANPAAQKHMAEAFNLRLVDTPDGQPPADCPHRCTATSGPFETQLRKHLPPGAIVIFDSSLGATWVRYADSSRWIVVPDVGPPVTRLLTAGAMMLVLAIIAGLIGAWQIQKPVLHLARAAREFRTSHLPPSVKAEGPSEVRGLIGDFNAMARELSDAEQERAVMLAGVAHDLRAPLTRIQLRASLVQDDAVRTGFLHDAESLSQIVTQFLDFARDSDAEPDRPRVGVDAFCQSHYADTDDSLFQLDLQAGDGFRLPAIELDRLLSNLVENAFSYGAPPLVIATRRMDGRYQLCVRDHGPGIRPDDFARALRPFVRIDPARGGDAHCGLGLTIVRRLTRRHGGELTLDNAVDGGLAVTLSFPTITAVIQA
jgi:two-component system, OmpR family, osmolarity sensor histidine kinase EnvZ